MKNVSHRNAPGAISAIALMVKPPRPKVALVVGFSFVDMSSPLICFDDNPNGQDGGVQNGRDGGVRKDKLRPNKKSPRPANPDRRLHSLSVRNFFVSNKR